MNNQISDWKTGHAKRSYFGGNRMIGRKLMRITQLYWADQQA